MLVPMPRIHPQDSQLANGGMRCAFPSYGPSLRVRSYARVTRCGKDTAVSVSCIGTDWS